MSEIVRAFVDGTSTMVRNNLGLVEGGGYVATIPVGISKGLQVYNAAVNASQGKPLGLTVPELIIASLLTFAPVYAGYRVAKGANDNFNIVKGKKKGKK